MWSLERFLAAKGWYKSHNLHHFLTQFELDLDLGQCNSLDWRQINQGGRGELYSPLQSLFLLHWCQQPDTKVVIKTTLGADKTIAPLLDPCYPCQECDLTGPPWLESLLADLAPHPHWSASSSPLPCSPAYSTITKSIQEGKGLTLIFSCWWYRHNLSKAKTKRPHLKGSQSRNIFHKQTPKCMLLKALF